MQKYLTGHIGEAYPQRARQAVPSKDLDSRRKGNAGLVPVLPVLLIYRA